MAILLTILSAIALIAPCLAEVGDICTGPVCTYDLKIRKSRTMIYSNANGTFNVALFGNRLRVIENAFRRKKEYPYDIDRYVRPEDVHTGDGYSRNIFLINEQFPGPTIEVMEGVTLVIRVHNNLNGAGLTIHWHGMEMPGTPEMDGTQYVTQCPIQPMQKFTYKFRADTPGTKWYHAHAATMRLDAFFGFIIVHKKLPTKPYFVLSLTEWLHVDYDTMVIMHPNLGGSGDVYLPEKSSAFSVDGSEVSSMRFSSVLINGRGRWQLGQNPRDKPYPLYTYTVNEGENYRFHMAHNGAESPMIFSIDEHKLYVVALDGGEIRPVEVDSFWIYPGETLDFEIRTTPRGGLYWIRAVVAGDGIGPDLIKKPMLDGRAILKYSTFQNTGKDPSSSAHQCSRNNPCKVFGCPFAGYPDAAYKECVSAGSTHYALDLSWLHDKFGLDDDRDVYEFFMNVGLQLGSSINGRSFAQPRRPLIFGDYENYITPCPTDDSCDRKGCKCTYLYDLPYGKTVQMVLTNYQPNERVLSSHPMHTHGHTFTILKMGYPEYDRRTGRWTRPNSDITCDSDLCAKARWTNGRSPRLNLYNPPTKDTVVVPANGYVVVRFRANLPGYWFMHCHQDEHFLRGMIVIFREGVDRIQLPSDFPRCGDFDY